VIRRYCGEPITSEPPQGIEATPSVTRESLVKIGAYSIVRGDLVEQIGDKADVADSLGVTLSAHRGEIASGPLCRPQRCGIRTRNAVDTTGPVTACQRRRAVFARHSSFD
jgi:hypothetical protein